MMELSEVVNPHFAFPVVGVVLCAFLVFAFGFKSPAEPPSFDFDGERKQKKSRPKLAKKKTHTNGHIVTADPDSKPPVSPKQVTATKQANVTTTKAPSSAEKSPLPQKEKSKPKKSPAAKPSPVKAEIRIAEKDSEDGWETVVVAKKNKKNKTKKDTEDIATIDISLEKEVESPVDLSKTQTDSAPEDQATSDTPQPQRSRKSPKNKAKEPENTKSNTEPTHVETEQVEEISVDQQIKAEVGDSKELTEEIETPTPKKDKKKKGKAAAAKDTASAVQLDFSKEHSPGGSTEAPTTEPVIEKPSSSSQSNTDAQELTEEIETPTPKKDKKKKGKAAAAKDTASAVQLDFSKEHSPGGSTEAPTTEPVIEKPSSSSQSNTEAQSAATSPQKSTKSPKKKKDKKKQDPVAAVTEAAAVTESVTKSSEASLVQIKAGPSQSNTQSIAAQDAASSSQSLGGDTKLDSAPSGEETEAQPKPAAKFDELGDWQEAKPQKKRKTKLRRD